MAGKIKGIWPIKTKNSNENYFALEKWPKSKFEEDPEETQLQFNKLGKMCESFFNIAHY